MVFLKRTNFLLCKQDSENSEPGIPEEKVFPPDRLELDDCLDGIARPRQALPPAPSEYFMIDQASDSQRQGIIVPVPPEPAGLGGCRIRPRRIRPRRIRPRRIRPRRIRI